MSVKSFDWVPFYMELADQLLPYQNSRQELIEKVRQIYAMTGIGMGTVTVYAHLQACGVVNDHGDACPCYHAINAQYPTVRKRRYLEKP